MLVMGRRDEVAERRKGQGQMDSLAVVSAQY